MVLSNLPRDAAKALSQANSPDKVFAKVLFKPVGSAPPMPGKPLCKISSAQRFEAVVAYLRRQLKAGPTDSVFLYVNSTFAPALDEVVGNLHRVSGFLSLKEGMMTDGWAKGGGKMC
jgi:ubiquitin-like protein ATG12